jgi:glyoxylase-like metal-dependent hydrolase (beta-lactamase superfamily II)
MVVGVLLFSPIYSISSYLPYKIPLSRTIAQIMARLASGYLVAFFASVCIAQQSPTVPTFAPIPTSALGPTINSSLGYRVEPFGGGAYMVSDGLYNSMFFVSTTGVVVVDAPPTIGHNLAYAIGNTTHLPVTHFVYSHAHSDHVGAAYLFKDATRIGHAYTKEILSISPRPNQPPPDVTFMDSYTLHQDNQTIELSYKGPNHEPGNIFIYAPKQKVLMLVDIVFPGWVPFAFLGEAEFVPGFIIAHDQILEYDFDHFVGGHVTRAGNRTDVLVQREYVTDLKANCANAIALSALPLNTTNTISIEALEPAVYTANPNNSAALFKIYLDDVAAYCNNVTLQKWQGRLPAADVWGPENSLAMVTSLRIDFDVLGPFGVTG